VQSSTPPALTRIVLHRHPQPQPPVAPSSVSYDAPSAFHLTAGAPLSQLPDIPNAPATDSFCSFLYCGVISTATSSLIRLFDLFFLTRTNHCATHRGPGFRRQTTTASHSAHGAFSVSIAPGTAFASHAASKNNIDTIAHLPRRKSPARTCSGHSLPIHDLAP
jgi:hypothetical protein